MLLPRLADQMLGTWTDTVLRPVLALERSEPSANGARSAHNGAPKGKNGKAAAAPAPTQAAGGLPIAVQAWDYWYDRVQRSWLLLDVFRQRGNDYLEHVSDGMPPLLTFDYEMILDGRTLPRPANYGLLRITPRPGLKVDPHKRPYVIVDPRAGHGPGAGGFKEDSQIGMAMRAGHPVYFVTFFREPVPGQTIADVHHVETRFIHKVRELHPEANKWTSCGCFMRLRRRAALPTPARR